jgi:16S rRNA (guanine(1405)-N(7))-methyltransferase
MEKKVLNINENMMQILQKIKQNKKYSTISDEIIKKEIQKYLKSNPSAQTDKKTVKEIRANLHRLYSSYQTGKKKKFPEYLMELEKNIRENNDIAPVTEKLLSMTLSTKERIDHYSYLYKNMFKLTGKPGTIIDLASGLNPLSFPLMGLKKLKYYAYDIDEQDINFLNQYFQIMKSKGLEGRAAIFDISDTESVNILPDSDIVFLFMVIDLLDKKKKNVSEELIKILSKKTRFIIASFATKTLTRKPMNLPRRRGFELMLERNNLQFTAIKTENEIFYIINK